MFGEIQSGSASTRNQGVIGGLTSGNLKQMATGNIDQTNKQSNNQLSELESQAAMNRSSVIQRKNFVPGLSIIKDGSPAAKTNLALVKRLNVNAPNCRQRFNKNAVHLRSMYRSLYPDEARMYE